MMLPTSGMVRGVVYFRFKHQPALDRIDFDASEIAVGDLKTKIAEKTLCNRQDIKLCELQPDGVNVKSSMLYDGELIHSGASLLVIRAPLTTKAGGIKVTQAGYFVTEVSGEEDGKDDDLTSRPCLVPETAVCPLCNSLMSPGEHDPVLLACCGQTACRNCLSKFSNGDSCALGNGTCPSGGARIKSALITRQVAQIIKRKESYEWRGFKYPESIFTIPVPEQPMPALPDTLDLDDWEAAETAVVDLESEQAPRRKVRVVNLVKDEIKTQLKAEYTQEDMRKLFRSDEKLESIFTLDIPTVLTVDFPRVLSAAEFQRWQSSS